MLQYSTYSVISPEGCASILWKSADKASQAAEAMGITAPRLLSLKLIDNVIDEPLGGAHRDFDQVADSLKQYLLGTLESLESVGIDKLLEQRYQKLMAFGEYREG
jgi:acetyl-CoA carboxylase carboxyl transferase subunit alpha